MANADLLHYKKGVLKKLQRQYAVYFSNPVTPMKCLTTKSDRLVNFITQTFSQNLPSSRSQCISEL